MVEAQGARDAALKAFREPGTSSKAQSPDDAILPKDLAWFDEQIAKLTGLASGDDAKDGGSQARCPRACGSRLSTRTGGEERGFRLPMPPAGGIARLIARCRINGDPARPRDSRSVTIRNWNHHQGRWLEARVTRVPPWS